MLYDEKVMVSNILWNAVKYFNNNFFLSFLPENKPPETPIMLEMKKKTKLECESFEIKLKWMPLYGITDNVINQLMESNLSRLTNPQLLLHAEYGLKLIRLLLSFG
jgi:hypothetical protein